METIIQDIYGGILLLKAFCFLLLNTSWPLYQNAGRNCIAGEGAPPLHFGWAALQYSGNGSVVEVEGERVGCWHGVVAVACEMDCEYWFLLALGDSFSSGALV